MTTAKGSLKDGIRIIALVCMLAAATLMIAGCGGKDEGLTDDVTIDAGAAEQVDQQVVPEEPAETVPEQPVVQDFAAMAPQEYGIEDVFFAFDEYSLNGESMAALEASARIMMEHPDIVYVVEGHCDERGTVEYNLALGEKRSIAVRDYLVTLGVAKDRLRITSYGEEHPFAHGHDESAWALNRRAHFSRP